MYSGELLAIKLGPGPRWVFLGCLHRHLAYGGISWWPLTCSSESCSFMSFDTHHQASSIVTMNGSSLDIGRLGSRPLSLHLTGLRGPDTVAE